MKFDLKICTAKPASTVRRGPKARIRLLPISYCLLLCLYFLRPVSAAEPEKVSVYAPHARYSIPVLSFDGRQYIGLLDLIEPLGTPELKPEGKKWKLRVPDPKSSGKFAEMEFEQGSSAIKIRGRQTTLSAPARVENHRLLLPLHGIGTVLIPLLGTDVTFHESGRRLFLGGAASAISSELRKGEPSILALHFAETVNPNIHSEGNALILSFTRDPVVSFTENQALNDKLFSGSAYEEKNGVATLTINGSAPLLAQFADTGRTILISAAPAPPTPGVAASSPSTEQTQPSTETGVQPLGPGEAVLPGSVPPPVRRPTTAMFVVVIDPGHGGSDTGARITPNLPEKEITLSLARKLRQELQTRHIAVSMLRDSDSDVTMEQRVVAANLARPSVFVSLHAEPGDSLRIFTPVLPTASNSPLERNSFLPWQSAQGAYSTESGSLASAAAGALDKRKLNAQVRPAFLQPLHSIAASAIAVEVPADSKGIKIPEDRVAGALADAIAGRKPGGGGTQ